ncbi:MAG: hypothetical protein JWP15_2063 [Alphaproteobacteria bacterium]|nr:hypothetical protein [Alphaproteobacteria bacterium]
MRPETDSMMLVRADLSERLECLRALDRRGSERDFVARVDSIRMLAAAYGLTPVVRLAEALEQSIGEDGRGQAWLYLTRLQDAIGCERVDEDASQAMLASVSVRFCC